jgi:hypothetical protein
MDYADNFWITENLISLLVIANLHLLIYLFQNPF